MSPTPAYRADGQACSRDHFYALACDPARSVAVEACAGAGKTWMLVSRIVRALLEGTSPREIVAITFTRKAAGEMRARLQAILREMAGADDAERVKALIDRGLAPQAAQAAAPELATLHGRLLAGGDMVQVQTFHAWFAQLMRQAPLELLDSLGLHPGMALVEDTEDLLPELMRGFHTAVLADAQAHEAYRAMVRRIGRTRLQDWWPAILERRAELELGDAAGVLDTSVTPAGELWPACAGLPEPVHLLMRDTALRDRLTAAARAAGGRAHAHARKAGEALERALELTDPQQVFDQTRQALFTSGKDQLRKVLEDLPAVAEAVDAIRALGDMQAQHLAHQDQVCMLRLSRLLLAQWSQLKRRRGVADMTDLERCALAVLGDSTVAGWVQQRLDSQVRHLLIDEFQDTSPLQWHALQGWLGSYAGAGGGASGQRPPSVFIVGDPKQSIYRFRRAEPRVFEAAREFVVQGLGGQVLECDHTRRNLPKVLSAVNAVFDHAVRAGEFSGFRPHSTEQPDGPAEAVYSLPSADLDPTRAARDTRDRQAWRDSLTQPRVEPEERRHMIEARSVASAVAELLGRDGMNPGDILVLARRRRALGRVEEALRERQIPCMAADERPLAELPQVRDLVALLDVLASPGHDLSLAQALKCPVFDVGDADLLALAQRSREGSGRWWATLRDWIDAPEPLSRARGLLQRWHQAAQVLPPHDLLDRIVDEGDVLGRMLAAAPEARRAQAAAAVQGLLAQALALDGGRYATPYGFVRALKRRALKLRVPARSDAVQLLTVHGAKGLEARAVFVVDTDPEPSSERGPAVMVDWPVQARHPARVAMVAQASRPPRELQALDDEERQARDREELNGLYVAMTRARERLVFSRTPSRPHQRQRASWWDRVQDLATPWVPADTAPLGTTAGAIPVQVPVLPAWSQAGAAAAQRPTAQALSPVADEHAARLGRAVHRVLEWAGPSWPQPVPMTLAAAAAAEFDLSDEGAEAVRALAQRVLDAPDLARFFDSTGLAWAGNEVCVADAQGRPVRMDRLVCLKADQTWWVLDYKLATRPQDLPQLRDQLALYRQAVRRLQPGQTVRAAFVTGDGQLVEPDPG